MSTRNYLILKYLKDAGEYVTSETLSGLCNVSTKTILKDIQSLNDDMKATDNYIEVKPSHGIKLIINDIDGFINLNDSYRPFQDFYIFSVTEREDWIQKYLIESNRWVKSESLSEMLYISSSVLSQNLKSVRKSLKNYDLELVQKPHFGMRVEGREFNKRLCLAEIYISYIDQREDFPGTQFNEEELKLIKQIMDIVDDVLVKFEISMSEVSVQNFIIDIFVSLKRIKNGILLKATDEMVVDIARWTDTVPAVELAKQIHQRLGIEIKDQEIVSFSIHLASKRIIRDADESIHHIIMNFDVNQIVNSMIDNICSKWHINFYPDREFRLQLAYHLIPLEVRSRYNVVLHNPLIDKIKQQNILAYQLAVCACKQLVDYHGNSLSDEEIGYIALHIHLALLRKQIKEKKNVLVMCGVGRGTSHILAYQIKEMYGKYINEIKTVDYVGIKNYDLTDIDLLISSIPIKHDMSVSKIEVNYFFNDNDKKNIETFLDDQEVFHMSNYIEKDMILKNINANTKEEAIAFMVQNTFNDDRISREIIENDHVGNYELENMISILSYHSHIYQTKIIIGILSKPILWDRKKIQIIIISLIGENISSKILDLYKELSYLAQNPIYIKRIIKKQSYEETLKVFEEIELKNM